MASRDRKSKRLNSSHRCISYAVFCLKKKKIPPRDELLLVRPRAPHRFSRHIAPRRRVSYCPHSRHSHGQRGQLFVVCFFFFFKEPGPPRVFPPSPPGPSPV